jgi:predicted metal-dependent hydrolase
MLALLRGAAGAPFGELLRHTEALGRSKQEKLELLLDALYGLLEDLLHLQEGTGAVANDDIRAELEPLAAQVDFAWLEAALERADGLEALGRRNIQKQIALEAFAVGLQPQPRDPA